MTRQRYILATLVLIGAAASPAAALPDTIDLGRGPQGELCRAERVWGDPAAPGLFDISLNVRCRGWTDTASVGRYRVTTTTAAATALLDKARDARLVCGTPVPVVIAGLGKGNARKCVAREAGYEAVAVQVQRGGKTYTVDGLKRFSDNLAAGLRVVAGLSAKSGEHVALVPADAPPPPASVAQAATALDADALGSQRAEVLDYSIRGQHGEAREIVTRYLAKLPNTASKSDRIELTLDAALSESNLGYSDVAKAYLDQAAALLDGTEAPGGASGDRLRNKLRVYRAIDALNGRDYPLAAKLAQTALTEDRAPVRLASLDNAPLRDPAILSQLNAAGASRRAGSRDDTGASLRGVGARDLSWIAPAILQAEALYVRAAALRATGEFTEASAVLTQAEKLLTRFDSADLETSNVLWLRSAVAAERGRIATRLGDTATARRAYAESTERLDRSTIYTDTPLVAQRRLDYARFLAQVGDRKEARVQYERALDVLKRAGPSTSSGVSGLEGYFGVLAADIAAGGPTAASARAQFFLASQFIAPPAVAAQIAQIQKIFESGSSDAAVRAKALQDLDRESRVLATRLASLPDTAVKDRAEVRTALDAAEARAVQIRGELAGDQQFQQASDSIATLAEVQAALKPHEAYVKLLTLSAVTYVIVATHDQSAVYPAGLGTPELAKLVLDVRGSIDGNIAPDGRVVPLVFDIPSAFKLHEALFGPGRDLLAGVTALVTEPTGAMTQLPFGVLVVDQASVDAFALSVMKNSRDYSHVKFLASTADLTTTVSPRSFLVARTQKASRATRPYLGFGYHAVPDAAELAAVPNRGAFAGRCAARADALRGGFASLKPIGLKELAAAAVMGPGSKLVEGADFSDSALDAAGTTGTGYRDFAVVHFATHGLKEGELDCDSPPALVTSISDNPASDGLLSFEEIANMEFDANLVVLSACNTAAETTASRASGSGIRVRLGQAQTLNGLVRAFLVAGSRAVLTTHWAIPDGFKTRDGRQVPASTQLIETLFKTGATESIGDSLRTAQVQMIANPDTSHPYYWGAFALVGDGARSMLARASLTERSTVALDLDKLSAPISGDAPCGPDLRDDVAFREIEDAPGEFAGQTVPDLRKVVARCVEFLARTKDQMPAIVAVQAAARAGDFDVANDALQLIHGFATTYWEDFHPGPAEEMAVGRVNELSALARPAALTLPLQRAALARMPAPSTAEFNAAMLAQASAPVLQWTSENESALAAKIASGAMTSVVAKTTKSTHEGARLLRTIMRTIAPAALAADVEAKAVGGDDSVDAAQAATVATSLRAQVVAAAPPFKAMSDVLYDIMSTYDDHSVDSPSFGPVIAQLKSIETSIDGFLEAFPDPNAVAATADGASEAAVEAGEGPAAATGGSPVRAAFVADTPRSRADVAAAIEGVLRFYAETEPSSPVPLMLRRVLTWVNKDFMELMKEIAPNGADEATKLLAIKSD